MFLVLTAISSAFKTECKHFGRKHIQRVYRLFCQCIGSKCCRSVSRVKLCDQPAAFVLKV